MLSDLGIDLPVLTTPMAGGPSTPHSSWRPRVGGLGFLVGGYKTAQALAGQIHTVRADGVPFGVNLFVPNPVPVSAEAYRGYARVVQPEAELYGLKLTDGGPVEDDDQWTDKVDRLTASPVPWASFTFGIRDRAVVGALRRADTTVLQNVTSTDEAHRAAETGVDALVVQASTADGHSATLTPERPLTPVPLPELVGQVRDAVTSPVIASGG
ncbi:nitronate monooxygenase [Streptomyces sp. NPDC051286]|uniref:nitronate monooxygenase n=1 Tax=Streptomyces sp. NPDC051286 TaxID=3365647 RepID=UPI00379EB5AC